MSSDALLQRLGLHMGIDRRGIAMLGSEYRMVHPREILLCCALKYISRMCCARVINGVGTGVLNAIVPVWSAEVATHTSRGAFIASEFTLNIFGVVVAYWLEFGLGFIGDGTSQVRWRVRNFNPYRALRRRPLDGRELIRGRLGLHSSRSRSKSCPCWPLSSLSGSCPSLLVSSSSILHLCPTLDTHASNA